MERLLLVDDRDGRVLAELEDAESALCLLDEAAREDPELADALCLVRFDSRTGTLVGAETTRRVRVLP